MVDDVVVVVVEVVVVEASGDSVGVAVGMDYNECIEK